MLLHSLYLQNFRNYEEAYIEFNPSFNLIFGANAQGKTSILEAIHSLMIGRSFRSNQTSELIRHGQTSFYLEGLFSKHDIEQKLRMTFDGKERQIIYNSTLLPTVSSLLGLIQGVIATPDDANLVKGSPQLRRRFLDIQLSQIDPLYVHHLTRYTQAMRQRNQLLKSQQMTTIESWEHEMSHSAAYVTLQRLLVTQDLQASCSQIHQHLTGEECALDLQYRTFSVTSMTHGDIKNSFLTLLQKNRRREMAIGYTLYGPHKDDLSITINGKDVRYFASEGQQRSCVMTLRLAEWQRLQRVGKEGPLMMMDDVGMGLDATRRKRLLDYLSTLGQVFLTTTDDSFAHCLPFPHLLKVHRGQILYEKL